MKLGIFDSGLGGLIITKAIRDVLPAPDIIYLGDTLHLPYGNRSIEAITHYTRRAIEHLFALDCKLVVIACNTASAAALRHLQQEWLPAHYPDRNIIGVIVPTLEATIEAGYKNIALIATNRIVNSGVYQEELNKINNLIELHQKATPLLVPLIEQGGEPWLKDVLQSYLKDFNAPQALILGCTHYPALKRTVREIMGPQVDIISQDDIVPAKLVDYLDRHPEYMNAITQNGETQFLVTDITDSYCVAAQKLYGEDIKIEKTIINDEH